MPKQIPVYLFVGQLESGKTKFIQETMEDPNFDSGDKTLLLVCEEGEIEYDPSKFAFGGVHVAQIEDKSELTAENLTALEKKSGCGRVIIEYNGMWLIQELYDALPDNWLIYQSLATADGTTIKTYAGDSAMRSLLLDKLRGSELLVVNRAEAVNDDESRQLIHKLVRQASRRCDIAYEFKDGSVAYDDIPDPLPFDVDAPVIEIPEEFFGIWYMDCMDDPKKYDGKTVKYLAQVCQTPQAGKGAFVPGRFAMTCCVQDIQFVGMPCKYDDYKSLEQRSWINITAKVNVKYAYGNKFNGDPDITAALAQHCHAADLRHADCLSQGRTILGALLIGTSRYVATEFTFYLAIPVMFGASLLKILKFGFSFTGTEVMILIVGMVVAFVVSIIAIKFLMGYIKKHDFKAFGWYRIALGILVLGYFIGKTLLGCK